MAPVYIRHSTVSSATTVASLSKLIHLVPAVLSNRHVKRGAEFVIAQQTGGDEEGPPADSPEFMVRLSLAFVFVILGGIFAGLTLALMGTDDLNLRVLATSSSDPAERRNAAKVLRLLSKGRHWVLVVLLLSNVIVNVSLPVFLDPVVGGGVQAVILSTVMILIFGEVIPQAVCVRYGLQIGGACAPAVWAMMLTFAPIAWPIAKFLDWILGHDAGHTYKKAELKSFLQFHREGEEPLRDDEITILNGVLSLNDRKVNQIMTPIGDCLTLASDKVLDRDAIDQILISGFSRIPVHEAGQPDNFIGMLLVKRLISYNPEDGLPVSKFPLLSLPEAKPNLNCFQALDYFQTGRAHLLLISDTPGQRGGAVGVLSLEDLIEEIIGEEIIDETDLFQDNHSKRKAQRKATATIMRGIIERNRVINALSRRPSGAAGSPDHSPAPLREGTREGVLVNLIDTPYSVNDSDNHDYLTAKGANRQSSRDVIYASPKPRLIDIDESPPAYPEQTGEQSQPSSHHEVDVAVIAQSPDTVRETIITAPAGDTKEDGSVAKIAKEITEEITEEISGQGKLIEVTVTDTDEAVDEIEGSVEGSTDADASDSTTKAPATSTSASAPTSAPTSSTSKSGGKKRKNKKKKKGDAEDPKMPEPYPTATSFATTAQAFVAKYPHERDAALGPERTNAGWEWRTKVDKFRGEQGYLARRATLLLPSEGIQEGEEEELWEEEDDAVAPHAPRRLEVEYSVVWSASYRVPMLCFRAWDESGTPSPLATVAAHFLRASIPTDTETGSRGDALLLPAAPFPLIQASEHPVTGAAVWSVHPCEVRNAVQEIVAAEGGEGDRLRWLEAWFMLSDSVVDLTL
ncbi:hypothetical protein CcaverHIS002_0308690 [Cutaneotrichosporon cavernicola]|uniref:CNNM transmembrane domain-containing protein n=1 Tax=Cutaneotrichosporon cavernicola TaxID=279322 RepID=A0AA48KZQ3_9TREE|nr:uncharacterized protein CcaverHIS019_0308540 [Cutaneotrichosporon cavernicola]BEI83001.1 hypothetical protein CcaverHIS002_0308690 [Cutaneotrichosporon cavernicola]BEI90784.1 hypothetical protein CcaverHIS019_0308540 [Cutaneotrichosporon cavernicola]BEI98563.1 hypothetical protein CcaverHIS631_0308620 [Cutaneotrichosporon cavernicola]